MIPDPVNRSPMKEALLLYFHLFLLIKDVQAQVAVQWSKIGAIKGQYFSDFSGSAIQMTSDAGSIAIHSYDMGSLLKGKTTIYDHSYIEDEDEHEWNEVGSIKYRMWDNDVSMSYAGDGSTVAIGTNNPFNVTIYHAVQNQTGSLPQWLPLGNPIEMDSSAIKSIDLSRNGNVLAISAHFMQASGSTMMYQYNSMAEKWEKMGGPITTEQTEDAPSKVSLSADGNIVAIGCKENDNSNGIDAGHTRVYAFNRTKMDWDQLGNDLDGAAAGDYAGKAVALSKDGRSIVIGAPKYDDGEKGKDAGLVKVMKYNTTSGEWTQLGGALVGNSSWISFGNSVDISKDGSVVAIGMAEILHKNQFVSVYKFEASNSTWVQVGSDLLSDETSKNYFGQSISLSDDGDVVAIGSPGGNDVDKEDSGVTVIYSIKDYKVEQKEKDILVNTGIVVSSVDRKRITSMAVGLFSIVTYFVSLC